MKFIKKGIAMTLALLMILAIGISASAEAPTRGSITIIKDWYYQGSSSTGSYPIGEFKLYRLFPASVAFDEIVNGSTGAVSYTGSAFSYSCTDEQKVVEGFSTYFTADEANNVSATDAAVGTDGMLSPAAVQWIKAHIAELGTQVNAVNGNNWHGEDVPYYTDYSVQGFLYPLGITFHNLPFGYYFIDSTVGTTVMINTTDPDVKIEDKNQLPTLKKKITAVTNSNQEGSPYIFDRGAIPLTQFGSYVNHAYAQIGDTVSYSLTVSAHPGAVEYILSDAMHPGLTLVNPQRITITADGEPLAPDNYTLLTDTTGEGYFYDKNTQSIKKQVNGVLGEPEYSFPQDSINRNVELSKVYVRDTLGTSIIGSRIVVIFKQDYLDTITGDTEIVLSYDAVLNQHAVNTGYTAAEKDNEATLNFSHFYYVDSRASVESFQLRVFKFEGNGESSSSTGSRPLNGVGFVLKREDGKFLYQEQDPDSENYLAITWVPDIRNATRLYTGRHTIWAFINVPGQRGWTQVQMDGYLIVDGLTAGSYTLVETDPLPGFNKPKDVNFSLPSKTPANDNDQFDWWYVQLAIANKTGSVLPQTGGTGTTIYYLLGFTVLLSCAAVLLRRRETAAKAR